jgi:thioredoxin-related protein
MAVFKTEPSFLSILLNPIVTAFIVFLLGVRLTLLFEKYSLQFFTVSYIILYSISLNSKWHSLTGFNNDIIQNEFSQGLETDSMDTDVNIFQVPFFKSHDSLFYIQKSNKFILIETWNEKCNPCINALQDLKNSFDGKDLVQFYMYEQTKKFKDIDMANVFRFEKIPDHNKIIIDNDNLLFNKLELEGNPYFLLFNPEGKLIFKYFGYHKSIKGDLINAIKDKIQ